MYFITLIEGLKIPSMNSTFVDSTKIAVYHNKGIHQHRRFADCATRGKNSVDWFYGFKMHFIWDFYINHGFVWWC